MHRLPPRAAGRLAVLVASLAALAASPLPVLAHAELTASSPKADQTLPGSPGTIKLDFSDTLKANSHFEVLDDAGATVLEGGPDPALAKRMSATVTAPLGPGLYEVRWTSVASDGDVERGTFAFTVAAAASPSATASATPIPTPSASESAAPSATPEASPSPTASPSASASPAPSATAAPGGDTSGSGGSDVIIPILVALLLVGGLGLWLARRQRRA